MNRNTFWVECPRVVTDEDGEDQCEGQVYVRATWNRWECEVESDSRCTKGHVLTNAEMDAAEKRVQEDEIAEYEDYCRGGSDI